MEGLNKAMLLGNLGADPELRRTGSGQPVLNMRLATTESYLDKDKTRRERTDWHMITVWGARGEALGKFLRKGMTLFVEGRIQTSSYDDREGVKRYKTEIVATNVIVTPRGKSGEQDDGGAGDDQGPPPQRQQRRPPAQQEAPPPPEDYGQGSGGDDEIPF